MDAKEIKDRTKMVDVVRRYGININRAGFCRCPFHNEKTASMKVYDKSFYCYGCGTGGDVFDFVKGIEHCDFATAFSILGGTRQRTAADLLAEYNREAKRRAKAKNVAAKATRLHDQQRLLGECRRVLGMLPRDSRLTAPLLAWYYALQDEAAGIEDDYFKAKEECA